VNPGAARATGVLETAKQPVKPPSQEPKPPSDRAPARAGVLSELLVLRAQEGSSRAFGQLVELWQERLWRHAYRLTGREAEAWDVLQESWLGIAKGLKRLREPSLFKRWAFTIVTRAAVTRLRQAPQEASREPESMERFAEPEQEQETLEQERLLQGLRSELQRMPRADRVLVSLFYLEQFELWEISRVLGVPEGTLKSRLHRIRQTLRERLERKYHE